MTPAGLRKKIRPLTERPSVTARFERDIRADGIKQPNVWYKSQKEHWLGWLAEYDGPGAYGRKNTNHSAEFAYNHINCSPMVLWLGEASGIPKAVVERARRAAMQKKHMGSQSAAIRKIISWPMIEARLALKRA